MKYDFTHLGAVLKKYKILYVPYYQRDYVWGTKNSGQNLYKFIDDIFTSYKEHPEEDYLIGTLAFCSIKINDIIDGQQRLTSLILLLSRLAENYCSDAVKEKHEKLLFPKQGEFIIQEQNYLTEEIKYVLGLDNNYNTQGYSVNLSQTVDRIDKQIENAWSGYNENWYDGLYQYILAKIKFAAFEYNNLGDALKYFLNNNSLSIPLTNVEIFYSILSQSIRYGETGYNIFDIKRRLQILSDKQGIKKEKFNTYKGYDEVTEIGIANIVYIFLKIYYQDDANITYLDEVGVGRWLSLYKNSVFNNAIEANKFVETFMKYLDDFEILYNQFTNNNVNLDPTSSLYISWVLLGYEKYKDILNVLLEIFKSKHNYKTETLYEADNKSIDFKKLNELAKRLNLTILKQYGQKTNNLISGYPTSIKTENGKYVDSIKDLLNNFNYDNYLSLTYKRDAKSNAKINDDSRLIKAIFACQEALLDVVADDTRTFGEYLDNLLLSGKFTVEHMYSIKEWDDINRLNNWQTKKNKFKDEEEFDNERFKFLNLSLLNFDANSTANAKVIKEKLLDYKQARKIFNSKPEYLIQSLVDDSDYYNNANIQAFVKKEGLPERKITNIDQNTWEQSPNNRQFNVKLIELAIKYIANI